MSYRERHAISVTTAADGSATAYSPVLNGDILAVQYVKDDFADTADFTITTETTAQNVWVDTNITASETVYPMVATNGTDGAALSGAGTLMGRIPVADERVKIVIAQGGNAKSGAFYVTVA
jgi:hypothetical protein